MTTGSILILSGFYQTDVPILSEKAAELDLKTIQQQTDGDWACLVLKV
jgi:ribosomal protein L11 methyltransferase